MKFTTESQAVLNVLASVLSLVQLDGYFAKIDGMRLALYVCMLFPVATYLANEVLIYTAQHKSLAFSRNTPHRIELLTTRSRHNLKRVLENQSSSLAAAYEEYRHRYGIKPPPGFQKWYEMASLAQSLLIDEYDSINHSVSPFLQYSGKQIHDMILHTYNQRGADLWLCRFSKVTSNTTCQHPFRSFDRHISLLFNTILANVTGLADVQFLVNHIDEPRVLLPKPQQASSHYTSITIKDCSRKPVWDLLTQNCEVDIDTTADLEGVQSFGLPFVSNISSSQDLCRHPEYSQWHGLVTSPVSFRPINGPVPVFSTGALSTMGDILIPSPAYIEQEFLYDETKDIEWEKKRRNLYWAGSTTGGFTNKANWRLLHRQRFVEISQNLKRQNYYLWGKGDKVKRAMSSFLNGRLFHVSFTRIFQCSPQACRNQDAYFGTEGWADKDEALKSTLAFDIDGNGISGRYYKLLASKSVPLKQTLLREWHDDRLVPWLHYVPISQSMEELPELVFYLTSTDSGMEISRQIAESSREWYSRAFRQVDLGIYTYRLLLEMARLQDHERAAGKD
ncbi:hypothetical protein ACLX1H_008253 [Fusarium chlamydosporum]